MIVNNGGYAALSEFASHFNITALIGTRLPGIDFMGLARALGCDGIRVERAADLAPALTNALHAGGPIVVDVVVA